MKSKVSVFLAGLIIATLTVGTTSVRAEPGASISSIRSVSASITVGDTHAC